jgi:hypothetical protein
MRLLAMVARRIMWMPPTLFGLELIVFAISHVMSILSASESCSFAGLSTQRTRQSHMY